jgi:carbamoyl-phosphate synthase large subunit
MQNINNYKNKKIFVSGGAGIIGQQLVKKLIELNVKVLIGDLKKCPKTFIGKVKYIKKDLNLIKEKEIRKFKPEIFIHLAASYERTFESKKFYRDNFHNNVKLSNHLLGIIFKIKSIKKIIFASSYLVYSKKLYLSKKLKKPVKLNVEAKILPRNLIGASKLYHEQELKFLSQFRPDISISSARIFRGYGIGSRDVISRWIRDILKNKKIYIYGKNSSFDFIYCKDAAESLINMINLKYKFKIVNVGYGKSVKISEVLNLLNSFLRKIRSSKIKSVNELENSFADISFLQKNLKFKPIFNIKKGIKEIIEYEKSKK